MYRPTLAWLFDDHRNHNFFFFKKILVNWSGLWGEVAAVPYNIPSGFGEGKRGASIEA